MVSVHVTSVSTNKEALSTHLRPTVPTDVTLSYLKKKVPAILFQSVSISPNAAFYTLIKECQTINLKTMQAT